MRCIASKINRNASPRDELSYFSLRDCCGDRFIEFELNIDAKILFSINSLVLH